MNRHDYNATITAKISASEAFKSINRVSAWWSENLKGRSENLNDIFTVHFEFGDTFTIKIIEFVIDKKIAWLVTDCDLTWVKDRKEWKGTKMYFEISTENKSTNISFTHVGLVPQIECYAGCVKGWDQFIKGSLFKLLTEGKGQPDKKK
jgi:hypothetical protein